MKTVFVHAINPKKDLSINCPFIGHKIQTPNEFISLVKSYFRKETGYIGLRFSTQNPNIELLFMGNEYSNDMGYKWVLYDCKNKSIISGFKSITNKETLEHVFELFHDTCVIEKYLQSWKKIVR